ncbi:MAG: Calcineurin-like phosphoesterase superfamily domain protein [Methanocella sp. PtaU1.Bin125]|nr:MAG: Calcineurin-like phosphoesterase superfamily domain protein [Methanocella sp. PtaU1.Bin125]
MQGSILLFSDIHADIGALDAILRLAGGRTFVRRFGRVERTYNLGDVVERGYSPCEVIDRLKSTPGLMSVRGNHDEAFIWSVPVSGSDARSLRAHEECRRRGGWEEFFGGMPVAFADRAERLYAVHGGPLDPAVICDGDAGPMDAWTASQAWQRISRTGTGYPDLSGYHYTPEQAFAAVGPSMRQGYAIVCGHEHTEAAYRERGGRVEDILFGLEKVSFTAGGRKIEEKRVPLEDDAGYLVRLGIAGPAGYYRRYGRDRCYFGVYYKEEGRRFISMLSFPLGRDAVPP